MSIDADITHVSAANGAVTRLSPALDFEEKLAIVGAFSGLLEHATEDLDLAVENITRRLEALMGGAVDLHASPLREAWDLRDVVSTSTQGQLSRLGALRHKKQVVLYGPPGTGKTYEAKELADRLIRFEAVRRWGVEDYLRMRERLGELVRVQVRRRQLHGGYSYEDFVVGLRVAEHGVTEAYRGDLLQLIDEMRASRVTSPDPAPLPWVLILDEINRTDLSRLLGEAFSALDDRNAAIDLPSVGGHVVEPLRLPDDLYIIGTMNLIDQSVEQFDFALRRRFLWLHSGFRAPMIPLILKERWEAMDRVAKPWLREHGWERISGDMERLAQRAAALNEAVHASPLLGEEYELGHTYFFDVATFLSEDARLRLGAGTVDGYLWTSDGRPLGPLVDLWTHSLQPLLVEYLSGLDATARDRQMHELEAVFLAPAAA
jgi:5-methylcytosine-specific restriction enzyme B